MKATDEGDVWRYPAQSFLLEVLKKRRVVDRGSDQAQLQSSIA